MRQTMREKRRIAKKKSARAAAARRAALREKAAALGVRVGRAAAGLGLFAVRAFRRGERIIEYTGERISHEEADRRGGRYLFEINRKWQIDGKGRDNLARYINHACRPNCEARVVRGRVFIYARRQIREGEELTYHYGKEYWDEYIRPRGCRCAACRLGSRAGTGTCS